ncbi:MAG TPA: oligosaccharide flippase family protein [Alphaproteobacteria bacterium]|nr:oligosaccharide flippase family protein [Alphaproteobacteria bacterium]
MSNKRALIAEALHLLALNFGGLLIGLVATVLITRGLGPEARGVYAWVFTIYGIAAQLALVVSYNTVRQMGTATKTEKDWPQLAGTYGVLMLGGWGLTLPLLAWAASQPLGQAHLGLLLVAWAGMPFIVFSTALSGLIHLRRKAGGILIPMLVPRAGYTLAIAAAWATRALTLELAVIFNSLMSVVSLGMNSWWLGINPRRWRFNSALARKAARFMGATWLAALAAFIAPKVVLIILPHYVGLADLGYYSVAATLLDIALMLPAAVASVLVSHFTRGESSAGNRRLTLLALLGVMAGAGAFGYVTAPYLLPLVFGSGFAASVAPFRILLLALLLQAPLAVYTSQLTAKAHALGLLLPPLASLFTTVLCAFWLIPAHGMQGAAMAVVAGYATQLLTTLPFSRKSRP